MIKSPYPLLHGPYSSPRVKPGEFVACEIRGLHEVKTFTDAPIPQPIKKGQGCAILVCGDLVRALHVESASAVAYWWGVSTHRVTIWRRALGIDRVTEGTRELLVENGNPDIGEESATGNAASLLPAARRQRDAAHSSAMKARVKKLGKPERERLGKLGRKAGRSRIAGIGADGRKAFARVGGIAASQRDEFAKRADVAKRWRTQGKVFRYERDRDKLVMDMRLADAPVSRIADVLGIQPSDINALLYDLASRYPVLADKIMTRRQIDRHARIKGETPE